MRVDHDELGADGDCKDDLYHECAVRVRGDGLKEPLRTRNGGIASDPSADRHAHTGKKRVTADVPRNLDPAPGDLGRAAQVSPRGALLQKSVG